MLSIFTKQINTLLHISFNVSNGVKQGEVTSPQLFRCYVDKLFSQLQQSGLGYHVGTSYARAFDNADGIAFVAHSMQCLKIMIIIWENFSNSHSITFNPNKSKLLCFKVDDNEITMKWQWQWQWNTFI